jgi:hypothetical protein
MDFSEVRLQLTLIVQTDSTHIEGPVDQSMPFEVSEAPQD